MTRPLTGREQQLVAAVLRYQEPDACTACGIKTWQTEDWTLWPWPDGAALCLDCNEARWTADPEAWDRLTDAGPER